VAEQAQQIAERTGWLRDHLRVDPDSAGRVAGVLDELTAEVQRLAGLVSQTATVAVNALRGERA
jgi:hypothetical protein